MVVEPCTLPDLAPDWVVGDDLARPDRAFFVVEGRRITHAAGREMGRWVQPLIAKETKGYIAFLRASGGGMARVIDDPNGFLIRAKAEPGNRGYSVDDVDTCVLVAPPVQFSQGNLGLHRKALAGELDKNGNPIKRVPFASAALEPAPSWVRKAVWEDGPEDGGRFDKKVNRYGRISVTNVEHLTDELTLTGQPDDFAWVTLPLLREIRRHGLGNGCFRSALSMLV